MATAAISLYRQLLRQEYRSFKGDQPVLTAAIAKTKHEFKQPCKDDLDVRLRKGQEVLGFMRQNLVQGVQTQEGHYRLRMTSEHEINDRIMPQKRGKCC
jgi:hypothetical protein